jgi:glycosyltransferase involved in cell wall biosynthesis
MIPEVSVIIPTYNRRAMVCEAVASVMDQTDQSSAAGFEIIVVDDGSTDGTAEELDRIADSMSRPDSDRIAMRAVTTENRGVAAARNSGVAIASAPLIAFLDSDDLWMPHKLERQLAFMRAHPDCEIAQTEETWIRDGRRVNPGLRHRKRAGDIFVDSLRTCLISPSAVILRTALFKEVGCFDERMEAAEDYDLWLRILARHQVGFMTEPLVVRRAGHPGQLSGTVAAIDRFRILALLKLIASEDLDVSRRTAVCEVLSEKCGIYANGLRRRGREADAKVVAVIALRAKAGWEASEVAALDDSIAAIVAIIDAPAAGRKPESQAASLQVCAEERTSLVAMPVTAAAARETRAS